MWTNWLGAVKSFWAGSSARIEAIYAAHGGVLNLIALAITIAGTYFGWRALRPSPKAVEGIRPVDADLRLRLLNRVQNERVDPRLRQGLRGAMRIDLNLTATPAAVASKLLLYTRLESGEESELPIHETVQEIFETSAGGRLLILGEPGTGKTNLLLELAQGLIVDARKDPSHPIPVIFNLSRWALGSLSQKQIRRALGG